MPYLTNLTLEDSIVYDYLQNVYNTITFKDVVSRYRIRNIVFLERLIEYTAENVGSLVSAHKISDFLKSQHIKISPNIALNYLSFLASSFLIYRVPRSEIVGKKIFKINEKYYFQDLGLRHTIIGYRSTDINKILENLFFLHLKMAGYAVTVGQLGAKKIDFVAKRRDEILYVQVAYHLSDDTVRKREFGNLLAIPDNYRKIVVSMDEMSGGNYQGIEHIHIREFLKKII